jgi:hypothetical protein
VNNDQAPATFVFAPEIEAQLVSICWHDPDRIGTVLKELDPQVHLTQPHLRHILEACSLAYRQLGCLDFPVIVQVLREECRLQDCGGLEGLNQVYLLAEHAYQEPGHKQALFDHYLGMLKTYAVNRSVEPPRPVYRFIGGDGELRPNKNKRHDSEPDFLGEAKITGRFFRLEGHKTRDRFNLNFLKIKFLPK